MRKAVVLHGTGSSSQNGWFSYIKSELEKLGMEVYVPDLPGADNPNIERYNKFLLSSGWDFNDNLVIGHSSGSVEIMGLLQDLPANVKVGTAILVGTFRGDLGRDDLKGMDIDFNYDLIKSKADKFIVIHSDNDPYCPLEDAKWIAKKLDAEFILLPGQQHFSSHIDPKYKKFPKLIEIVRQKVNFVRAEHLLLELFEYIFSNHDKARQDANKLVIRTPHVAKQQLNVVY